MKKTKAKKDPLIEYGFICHSNDCVLGKGTEYTYTKKVRKSKEDDEIVCPECGDYMINKGTVKALNEPNDTFSVGYLKFHALSSNEKKAMLSKRATAHFNTHIKEKKELMDRGLPT